MRRKILKELMLAGQSGVSGTNLAESLGISRVAVWKHIESLKKQGYSITGIPGKGYALSDINNIVIPEEIQAGLNCRHIGGDIRYYTEVNSTNKIARQLLQQQSITAGSVIVAGRQQEGRGRRGRGWESPCGGLWFSLVLSPGLPLPRTALLSLVFAVAISRALDDFLDFPSQIKWPNDILVDGKKIVGILLELYGELEQPDLLIAGIGINVNVNTDSFPSYIRDTATSLQEIKGREMLLSEVLSGVLAFIDSYYDQFISKGFAGILAEYKNKCLHLGQNVKIDLGPKQIQGINVDIDELGNLWVDTEHGIKKLSTGDVAVI